MYRLSLLRHGESVWNRDKRFTGWSDVALSPRGAEEAESAARRLIEQGFVFDLCFTSYLSRASETLRIVLDSMGLGDVPVIKSWQLNERHYGALQGLGRWEALKKFGPRKMIAWQRDFALPPPALEVGDPRFPGHDPLYAGLAEHELPRAESLKDTLARIVPYWQSAIAPEIRAGKRVLIVTHRNTLRALIKHLDRLPGTGLLKLRIPTGKPLVYELDRHLTPLRHYYLESACKAGRPASPRSASARP